ncbi:MAG: amino acid ABC transporter permease [Anaerolineales bacterium]|nr:amino acid ABC transporter permease [Anaerolineales bacterium]
MAVPASAKSPPARAGRALPMPDWERVPWWMIILVLAGILAVTIIFTSADYTSIITLLSSGIYLTLYVTFFAYVLALIIGLLAGLMRVSRNPVLYTIGTLYVEVVRGIPLLVQILYFFYVIAPALADRVPEPIDQLFRSEVNMGIIALAIGYGAYLAETYRAGIEAIPRGQMEAARSLGMSYVQAMRYVVLPQALRIILPPLGNDFVAMLKDSALLSAISVKELTLWTRQRSANTFRPLEHWTIAALLYLAMTIGLSLVVRYIERKFAIPK